MKVETTKIVSYTIVLDEEEMRLIKSLLGNCMAADLEQEFKVSIQEMYSTCPKQIVDSDRIPNIRLRNEA